MGSTFTAHYNFEKPEKGAGAPGTEWDLAVNGNFDSIDTLLYSVNDELDVHKATITNPHHVSFGQTIAELGGTTDCTAEELEQLTNGSNCDNLHEHDTTAGPHGGAHESGGGDEISIGCLLGMPIELQDHLDSTVAHPHTSLTVVGADDHHSELHTVASHSDTNAIGAELNELVGAADTDLHFHNNDRNRVNHIGTLQLGTNGFEATADSNSCFGNGAIETDTSSVFVFNTLVQEDSGIFLGLKADCTECLKVLDTTTGTGFQVGTISGLAYPHTFSFWYLIVNGQ